MKCWRANYSGQVGDGSGSSRPTPMAVSGLSGVTALTASFNHTCAITGCAGKCWGDNFLGQLGDGSNTNRKAPVAVSGLGAGVTVYETVYLMARRDEHAAV